MTRSSHDLRRCSTHPTRLAARWFGACALGFLSLTAHAQATAPDWPFEGFMARTQGNTTTVGFASNGTPVGSSAPPPGSAGYKGIGINRTGGQLYLESLGKLKGPEGHDVPIRSKIAATGRAFGKALWRAAPFVAALGLVGDVANIWSDLGYTLEPDGTIGKVDSTGVHVSIGQEARLTAFSRMPYLPAASGEHFCVQAVSAWFWANGYNGTGVHVSPAGGGCRDGGNTPYAWAWRASASCPAGWYITGYTCTQFLTPTPVTESEFLEDLASLSHFPERAPEALRKILENQHARQGFTDEMLSSGNKPVVTFPQPSGPDTLTTNVGQPKVSQKNSTNSIGEPIVQQTVEQKTAKAEQDRVTYHTTNVTNIYNETTNITETTTEEKDETPEEKCKDGDTSLGCAEFGDPPTDDIPTASRSISFVPENLFGGGTCPTWPSWSDSLGDHEINLDKYCELSESVIRPLLLAMAVLAAIFIVVPARGDS